MELRDYILERLEMRRMENARYKASWCGSCLRVSVNDPDKKGSFALLGTGDEECRQEMHSGTITECIVALRNPEF